MRILRICILAALAIAVFTPAAQAGVACVTGTTTVSGPLVSGPFTGQYKYTVTLNWDVTGLNVPSHFDVFLQLTACACICNPNLFNFDTPAGTSPGEDGQGQACTVEYEGLFQCEGDPALPGDMRPAVKFEIPEQDCEPLEVGSAELCFYSVFGPTGDENTESTAGVKHGNDLCEGTIFGPVPLCDCGVPVDPTSWGRLKTLYRPSNN